MFLRIDKLGVEIPASTKYDPTAAAAVQELFGGRFRDPRLLLLAVSLCDGVIEKECGVEPS